MGREVSRSKEGRLELCAIVQPEPVLVTVDQVRRAFRSIAALIEVDAVNHGRDAYGILAQRLDSEDAQKLASAFRQEGIEAAVISQSDLPALPAPRVIRRLDALPENLILYDALGRTRKVDWAQVTVLAAGRVTLTEFVAQDGMYTGYNDYSAPVRVNLRHAETRRGRLLLEFFLTDPTSRFRVEAETFRYDYLGSRKQATAEPNFALLAHDMRAGAPLALCNRGLEVIATDPSNIWEFSKRVWEKEIAWMRWKRGLSRPESHQT